MGASKSAYFNEKQNQLALLMKAMAHPARIAIIEYLIKANSCICGSIVDELPLAQPTISQHLKELKGVGLIQGTIEGKSICYCINKENFAKYLSMLNDLLKGAMGENLDCCN